MVQQSPFVKLFAHAGIAQAAGIMNFVVITAALSSMNTNIYLSSRMLFSLSRGGYAPGFVGKLTANGTPLRATLISGAGVLATTSVSFFSPHAYNYLFGVALFGGIFVWIMILGHAPALPSRLAWRRAAGAHAAVPIAQITGIALLVGILVTMGLDTEFWNISWIIGVPWLIGVSLAYVFWRRRQGPAGAPAVARGRA